MFTEQVRVRASVAILYLHWSRVVTLSEYKRVDDDSGDGGKLEVSCGGFMTASTVICSWSGGESRRRSRTWSC